MALRSISQPQTSCSAFAALLKPFFNIFLVSLLILTIFRLSLLLAFGPWESLSGHTSDLLRAFGLGIRFDAKLLSILYFPLIIPLWVFAFWGRNGAPSWLKGLYRWWGFVVLLLLLVVGIVDIFYFQFFKSHIDILAFNILYDSNGEVLHSLWSDFPVVWVAVGLVASIVGLVLLTRLLVRRSCPLCRHTTVLTRALVMLVLTVLLGFLARGTLLDRPLGPSHTVVSQEPFINQLPMNAPLSLQYAYKHYTASIATPTVENQLRNGGFSTLEEAVATYLRHPTDSENPLCALIDTTGYNPLLDTLPPHVVVLQMESLGEYYMGFNRGNFNLLGALADELTHLIHFPNFFSCMNNTPATLEGMLFGSPFHHLGVSTQYAKPLPYSAPWTYKRKNYETWYITGQRLGWRNLDLYLAAGKGFDHIEGDNALREFDPQAHVGEWGVHDASLFKRIWSVLQASPSPKFIYGMSISHHTPYDAAALEPYADSLQIPDSVTRIYKTDPSLARRSFLAFRYAANQLGLFLRELRQSPLGQRTIVAITGDHTLRQILNVGDDPLANYAVPLLLYIPEQYMPKYKVDTTTFSSQNDIFPTLYHLTLSQAKYLHVGCNLLDSIPGHRPPAAVYTNTFAMNRHAFAQWTTDYYATRDTLTGRLHHDTDPTPAELALGAWGRSYMAVMGCFIARELENANEVEGWLK